ncbi:nonstructural protein [Bogoria virus]|uniref:Nonstructural protein n=1 Tax=Bogoria virus TaxID=2767007 RepID=A0A7G8PYK1_9VIRU|nr:nonstructural protein [Bogoria virus]QNJ99607.1 nonstructural protein [Bogoria virus]
MLKATENYFLHDYPHKKVVASNKESRISFQAYNKTQKFPVIRYKTMEIPCVNFIPSGKVLGNLSSYYVKGMMPRHWGDEFGLIRTPEIKTFDTLMKELTPALVSEVDFGNHMNINEALRWPTRYPTTISIRMHSIEKPNPLFLKNVEATLMLQSTNGSLDFDKMFMRFHRKIIHRASVLGLNPEWFSGRDLLKECAVIQCVMLLNAYHFDELWFGQETQTIKILKKWEKIIEQHCPEFLGNRKWTPVPAPEVVMFRNI